MSGGDIAATHEVAGQVRRMGTTEIRFDTSCRKVVDLTGEVEQFCAGRGDGLCSVFVPHATAGVSLMETGSGSEEDLIAALERLLPHGPRTISTGMVRGATERTTFFPFWCRPLSSCP